MNYPLISEYVEAIKAAEDNFDQLKHLRPVLGEDGEPVMTSGNFAVVFKMKDGQTGKLHAVKCFLKEQEGRAEAYRQIAEELEYVSSTFLTPIKYLDKELFVDSANSEDSEFPVLLMDWVEGQTLDKYIREHIDDQYELSLLAYQFSRLAMWLMPQPFAHGDLKPDNILVKEDGTLVLVDYDGMYVPAMKGQKARELGSPDFRHPGRTEEVFDDHIDDFSLASILLSLKAIALQPSLLEEYGASDRLLFSEKDYRNLSESSALGALQPLMQDAELASLYSLYILALSQNNLSQVSFRLFNLSRPDRSQYEEEILSTEVTEEDLANAWTDEFGVKYSKDRKKLLKAPDTLEKYSILDGTVVICDEAFPNRITEEEIWTWGGWDKRSKSESFLKSIIIPNSVTIIGNRAFAHCYNLKNIYISNSLVQIGSEAFYGCHSLISFLFPHSLKNIGEEAFYDCWNLQTIFVPSSLEYIGTHAFRGCQILNSINVDKENIVYDSRHDCNAIIETKTNTLIVGCASSVIPKGVEKIDNSAFFECFSLKSLFIPEGVDEIGEDAFWGCKNLISIHLPNSLIKIGDSAFSGCNRICSISLPYILAEIGDYAFSECFNIDNITLPRGLKKIGNYAFSFCSKLISIHFPSDVEEIGENIFEGCDNLNSIFIPHGTNPKYDRLLFEYRYQLVEQDEDESLSTEVTDEDLANSWTDEFGVKYSKDRIRLIKAPSDLLFYTIKDGTQIICDSAFVNYDFEDVDYQYIVDNGQTIWDFIKYTSKLKAVSIPNSVVKIGKDIFDYCCRLESVLIPIGTQTKFEKYLQKWKEVLVETPYGLDLEGIVYLQIRQCAHKLFSCFDNKVKKDLNEDLLLNELRLLGTALLLNVEDERINECIDFVVKQKILDGYLSIKEVDDYDIWIVDNTPGMYSNDLYSTDEAISLAEFEMENGQVTFYKGKINAYPYDDSFWGEFVDKNGKKQIIYVAQGFPFEYNVSELSNNKSEFGIVKEKETNYQSDDFVYCLKKIKKKHSMLLSYIKERLSFYKKSIEEIQLNRNNYKSYIFQLYNAVTNEMLNYNAPYLSVDDLVFDDDIVVDNETGFEYHYSATSLNDFTTCFWKELNNMQI